MARTFGEFGEITVRNALVAVSSTAATISSGASGDVLTATAPPAGQIGFLRALRAASNETGMTLTVDGNTLQSGKTLTIQPASNNGDTTFVVAAGFGLATSAIGQNCYPGIYFTTSLVLTKDSGSTAADINYAIDYLEVF